MRETELLPAFIFPTRYTYRARPPVVVLHADVCRPSPRAGVPSRGGLGIHIYVYIHIIERYIHTHIHTHTCRCVTIIYIYIYRERDM